MNKSDGDSEQTIFDNTEKSGSLIYDNSNLDSSFDSLLSDYHNRARSLLKEGKSILALLTKQFNQKPSGDNKTSDNSSLPSNKNTSTDQAFLEKFDALLKDFSKLIEQNKKEQASHGNNMPINSQLSSAMSQMEALIELITSDHLNGINSIDDRNCTGGNGNDGSEVHTKPKDEKDTSVRPSSDTLFKNMDGDKRTADEIINNNPVLKNLGNQKDIKQPQLKERFGDWTADNPDPKSRALAAKNMSWFLNSVKALKNREGGDRGDQHTNTDISGITKNGDARHGTEAAIVKDVAEQGLDKMFPKDGQLTKTNDNMVNLNGSTKSDFQGICLILGKVFAFLPLVSNVLTGMGKTESTNPWEVIKGGAQGFGKTIVDGVKGVIKSLMTGKFNPISMIIGAYKEQVTHTTVVEEEKSKTKSKALDIFDKVF